MFIKTSSATAKEYLEVSDKNEFDSSYVLNEEIILSKSNHYMFRYNRSVYIEPYQGIATIAITDDLSKEPSLFIIQNQFKIRSGLFFCFVANSFKPKIKVRIHTRSSFEIFKLAQEIQLNSVNSKFIIDEIYAVFFLSKNIDYSFPKHTHDYYELTYIDNGEMIITQDNKELTLRKNDLIITKPGTHHSYRALNKVTFISIMFSMTKSEVTKIVGQRIKCTSKMVQEIEKIYNTSDVKNQLACELIVCYLKSLISMIEHYDIHDLILTTTNLPKKIFENEMFNEIINYIHNNIYTAIDVEEICKKFGISRTTLQNLFRDNLQTTPKLYINDEKLALSKTLLKYKHKTVSEVAEELSYASVHYFSRVFKSKYNINPSEYAQNRKQKELN